MVSKLYAPLVQSHMDNGLTVWGNCGFTNMDKVKKSKIEHHVYFLITFEEIFLAV